jgi:hypothetical protein
LTQIKAVVAPGNHAVPANTREVFMTAGSITVLAGTFSAFLLFAVVLMWADRYSRKPHSQSAKAQPTAPVSPERLAA